MPDFKRAADYPGIVMDTDDAEIIGNWPTSASAGPYVGFDYLHDGGAVSAENVVRYTPKLPQAGRYEVRVSYSPNPNRADKAMVRIHSANGPVELRVNQRQPAGEHAPFVSLGVFELAAGGGAVEIAGSPDAGGYVTADAVQWLYLK